MESLRILGIDPGTNIMGFGIIEVKLQQIKYVDHGIRRFNAKEDAVVRLGEILNATYSLIETYSPSMVSIESPFFGKNVQSMLKLGRAQGVVMAASMSKGLDVFEYAPRKIKQSITGRGQASKEQVAEMLFHLLQIDREKQLTLDATDALAAAFCHFLQLGPIADARRQYSAQNLHPSKQVQGNTKGKKGDWRSFLDQNPDRKL